MKPNFVATSIILLACACMVNLDKGNHIHDYIIGSGIKSEINMDNVLIEMYAKCGSLEIALMLFEKNNLGGMLYH